jgi:hypothetical protein
VLVTVLKRFEGPAGRVFQPGETLDLEGRNIQGLIDFRYLAPAETVAAQVVEAVQAPPPPPPPRAAPRGRKTKSFQVQ